VSETVDVNVLVYASNSDAPEHERAAALVAHLAAGPGLVVLLWPVLMGYLRLATHPSVFSAPLSYADAMGNVDSLLARPNIRVAGEGDSFWDTYQRSTIELAPRGNLVPDAHLVALMLQHGVSTIWSRDRDLRKFDGIAVADPFADRYRDGFDGPPRRRRRPS
jgi:toxin-antitoxin system PIN domain toxin